MVWPLIAMAAVSAISSGQQQGAQQKAATAQNKAIREANRENTIKTGFQVGLLNVQRGQRLMQRTQRMAEVGQGELIEAGAAGNNAAAAGTVGASVDAVQQDIELKFDRMRDSLELENEIEAFNYNTALHDVLQGGQDKLVDYVRPGGQSGYAILGQAAISTAGSYYGSKMSLGLGQQSTAPITRG